MRFGAKVCAVLALTLASGIVAPGFGQQPGPKPHNVTVFTRVGGSYLGIYVLEVDAEMAKASGLKEERGVQITKVDPESPASRAGLRVKDIILSYNDQRVEGLAHFMRLVMETPPGRKVSLGVFRNGSTQTLNAVVGARPAQEHEFFFETPAPPAPPALPEVPEIEFVMPDIPSGLLAWQSSTLGYMAEPIDGQLAEFFGVKEGVLVRSVAAKSAAEKAGLKAGDVIIKADGRPVRSPREVTGSLRRQREKRQVTLTVIRNRKEMTVEMIAKSAPDLESAARNPAA